MACFHPLDARRSISGKTGTYVVHLTKKGDPTSNLKVPCGQCIGCRIDKSREWALRCHHEAQLHEKNSFLTLTYNDENLPHQGVLIKHHLQKFFKRLRTNLKRSGQCDKIRYYACGEYGEKFARPHFHVCLFGYDFPDKYLHTVHNGNELYRSHFLEKAWPYGFASIGQLTFESAAYVARYILKKKNGKQAVHHYEQIDETTGEVFEMPKEFTTMSLRPGIGHEWYQRFKSDCYPSDFAVHEGKKHRVPRYYDKILEKEHAELHSEIKQRRLEAALQHLEDNTPERLEAKEAVLTRKTQKLIRNYEK